MDPNKSSGRTNIIDDLDVVALAQQGQRKAPKKSKKSAAVPSTTTKAGSLEPGPSKQPRAKQEGGDPAKNSKSKPAKNTASKTTFKYVYEKDGLRIPLYDKGGRLKPSARLSKTLRAKGTDVLLKFVEEIAGVEKRNEFKKADLTKLEIAEWIEEVETRALGPHPRSLHSFVKDDFVIETENYLPMAQPELAPEPKSATYHGKGKAPMHSSAQDQGKRKRDEASEPARGDQQTAKKAKTRDVEGQLAKQLPTQNTIYKTDASTKNERRRVQDDAPAVQVTKSTPQKAEKLPSLEEDMDGKAPEQRTEQPKGLDKQARLEQYMAQTGLDNKDASSQIVVIHDDDEVRILTASTAPNGRPILHMTSGPIDVAGAAVRLAQLKSSQPAEPPFLKKGQHGRHGDFESDTDRRTGRGHQLTRQDEVNLDHYYQFRGKVLAKYPCFPAVREGHEVHEDVKTGWYEGEKWYNGFTRRFPGFSVNHLWPCGCEKLKGEGSESESESEEE